MKVMITGAAGSVGRRVTQMLVQRGHKCKLFDIPTTDLSAFASSAEVFYGDVRDATLLHQMTTDVDCVVHLAAVLPPASERDRAVTMAINCQAVEALLAGLGAAGRQAHLVLASSVSTYGDTTAEIPPIRADHPQRPLDIYAESKILAEKVLQRQDEIPWTILRIAGIAVPEFLEPPPVWPFQSNQRVEFVSRDDVALALANCVGNAGVRGRILNIAGGPDWQMKGNDFVAAHYEVYGVDIADARFRDEPGWLDWYETAESQDLLTYQQTSFPVFCELLTRAVEEALDN